MRKLLLIFVALLLLSVPAFASRNSDDIVTASNSAFNNYITDVVGNKGDGTNIRSTVGLTKKGIALTENLQADTTNLQNNIDNIELTVTNTSADITNLQNNVDTIEFTVTNTRWLVTNMQNNVDIIEADVTNAENNTAILTGYNVVPTADTADNVHIRDVIGNKSDTHDGDSIMSLLDIINEHWVSKVYPTAAAGATIEMKSTAWTASNGFTNVVVPASTITSDFDIHYVSIESISANGVYEVDLYNMDAMVVIGSFRFVKSATQDTTQNVPVQCPIQPANAKIGARAISSTATQDNVVISLFYNTH